jgi:hypothetical protein
MDVLCETTEPATAKPPPVKTKKLFKETSAFPMVSKKHE